MTVHDAMLKRTRLIGQLHSLQNSASAGFLLSGQMVMPYGVAPGLPRIWRLFPIHLIFISFLLIFLTSFIRGNVSRDNSCFVMCDTKRYAIRFYRE